MRDIEASPDAKLLLEATQDYDRAQAEPDFVARGWFEKFAQQKVDKAARKLAAEDLEAMGAKGQAVVRNGAPGLQLKDTYESPRAIYAHAQRQRLELAERAECLDLAIDLTDTIQSRNSIERALAHQMAAAHTAAMTLMRRANERLQQASQQSSLSLLQGLTVEGVRLMNCSARTMAAFQAGAETLAKLRTGGQQTVTVVHQHVQVAGGTVSVAGSVETGGTK